MSEKSPNLTLKTIFNPAAAREIWEQLFREDQTKLPEASRDFPRELHFLLYNEDNQLVGGLLGAISWGSFFVRTLWIDKSLRGRGEGRKLMEKAEELARSKNLDWMITETADFNAPDFYLQMGFEEKGRIDGFPAGHTYYYLAKKLD